MGFSSRPKSLEGHDIEEEDEVLRASKSTPNLVIQSGSRSSSEKSCSPSGNVSVADCNGNLKFIYVHNEALLIDQF